MTGATGNVYCGLHEFADMGFLLHLLRPGDIFVDVGANIGSFTVLASAVVGADTIAIEPDPGTMISLKRNIELNAIRERVTLVEAAIGSATGVAKFTVGLDTINHLATDSDSNTRDVRICPLDEVLRGQDPLMIKFDVEGFEAGVIAGASDTLKKRSLIAIETEGRAPEVLGPLRAAGFNEMYYEPFSRELSTKATHPQANALFIRDVDQCSNRLRTAPVRMVFGRPL